MKLRKDTVSLAGPLKEWVSLECEGDKPPRIRTARPLTSLQHEGTRKRRRAAMGDYAWSVGDRVDTWIQERYPLTATASIHSHLITPSIP
jgi:hypothetical protein